MSSDDEYRKAIGEYRDAKAALEPWIGRSGPAQQIIDMERRLEAAAWRLAEMAFERDGR